MGTVRELDADTYSYTQLSEALPKPIYRDSVIFLLVATLDNQAKPVANICQVKTTYFRFMLRPRNNLQNADTPMALMPLCNTPTT